MAKLHVDIKRKLAGFSLEVSFEIEQERMGLLGASGSGKSMTLCCIAGILKPDEGVITLGNNVLFDSKAGINLPPQKRNIGFFFQNYALFPHMTVEQNVAIGLINRKKDKDKIKRVVAEKIQMFQLLGLEKRYPRELSGGEQQRVALARMLAYEPDVLLLDEPFSALDSYLKWQIEPRFLEVVKSYCSPIIFVSHNRDEIYRICTDIAVISNGRIDVMGEKHKVFEKPQTLAGARLTGLKNVSRARKCAENLVEAIDWNILLKTGEKVDDKVTHVGIRAHCLKPVPGSRCENLMKVQMLSISETPFSVTVLFKNADSPKEREESQLLWELDREQWSNIERDGIPEYLALNSDQLLLLNEGFQDNEKNFRIF